VTSTGNGASGPQEILQLGPPDPPSRWRWAVIVVAVLLVGSGVAWAVVRDGSEDSGVASEPTPTRTALIAGEPDRFSVAVPAGPNLLGVTDGWELIGRGPEELVRIELASGRVTRTSVPRLGTSGPVSLIVASDRVVVRPLDYVPGYQVVDGDYPTALPPALRHGGLTLPGPRPDTVWALRSPGSAMRLARVFGGLTGTTVRLPADSWATSDGGGYILAHTPDGVWWARPNRLTRISDGTLLAAGPTGWLVRECGQGRCAAMVIDRYRGTRRPLPGPAVTSRAPDGVIAPDGSTAALFHVDERVAEAQPDHVSAPATVTLLDLQTGGRRTVQVPVPAAGFDSTAVWSPDSRWLFVAGADRGVAVVDPATGEVRDLDVPLPAIAQVAVRPCR
jgi:hypothetical protein